MQLLLCFIVARRIGKFRNHKKYYFLFLINEYNLLAIISIDSLEFSELMIIHLYAFHHQILYNAYITQTILHIG